MDIWWFILSFFLEWLTTNVYVSGYDLIEWLMDRLCIEDSRKYPASDWPIMASDWSRLSRDPDTGLWLARAVNTCLWLVHICSSRGCPPRQPVVPVRLLLPRQRTEKPPRQGRQLPLQISGKSERSHVLAFVAKVEHIFVFVQRINSRVGF